MTYSSPCPHPTLPCPILPQVYMDDTIIGNLTITLVNLTRVIGKEGQVVEQMIYQALTNILSTHTDLSSSCAR